MSNLTQARIVMTQTYNWHNPINKKTAFCFDWVSLIIVWISWFLCLDFLDSFKNKIRKKSKNWLKKKNWWNPNKKIVFFYCLDCANYMFAFPGSDLV
jgi:hypothetical protein